MRRKKCNQEAQHSKQRMDPSSHISKSNAIFKMCEVGTGIRNNPSEIPILFSLKERIIVAFVVSRDVGQSIVNEFTKSCYSYHSITWEPMGRRIDVTQALNQVGVNRNPPAKPTHGSSGEISKWPMEL
ncbi:predicted protein [Botrytis cinerea T4]|uniref:Uncharacterized protein n=1 Tax=Botryotinia fuckeliana (strain T4) TaxID=999810 RepID=G2Y0I6_BOTF4|nr:predicted protein [Botrytis cinerea T4]